MHDDKQKSHLSKMALILLCLFIVPHSPRAQTAAETATRWGLLGTWQTDCNSRIYDLNVAYTYAVRGNQLLLDRNFGRGSDSSVITKATPTARGGLVLLIDYAQYSLLYQYVLARGADGRLQMVEIKDLKTNAYTIKDGKKVVNGAPAEWWTRCH